MAKILLIDDEARNFATSLEQVLDEHYLVPAVNGAEGLTLLEKESFDLVLLDIRMPATVGDDPDREGLAVLKEISKRQPELPVLMLSVFADVDTVVEAIQAGAFHYIPKPPDAHKVRSLVERALQHSRLASDNKHLKESIRLRDWADSDRPLGKRTSLGDLVGASAVMQRVYQSIEKFSAVDACVLIRGETGTGKELVAREIHNLSKRSGSAFIAVNCAAIPENLLESELFGHKKGSFTGATEDKQGLFVQADGGTLFLDEIGDLDLNLQTKLLRVLQDQVVAPVGGKPVQVNVRLLCATHRNLDDMISQKQFRADLFYRVDVLPLRLPPLRERQEDIPILAEHFIQTISESTGLPTLPLNEKSIELLANHSWPGNVRELENAIQRALVNANGKAIRPQDLELDARSVASLPSSSEAIWKEIEGGQRTIHDLTEFRNEFGEETLRYVITKAVQKVRDYTAAGQLLGFISTPDDVKKRNTFRQWIKRLGLSKNNILGK